MPACEAIVSNEDFTSVVADHDTLINPAKMADIFGVYSDDLQINGYSVLYMIEEAVAAMELGDYEQFGKKLGQVMQLVNVPKANQPEKIVPKADTPQKDMGNIAEMLQGFFSGVGIVGTHYQDILVCIYEADQAALELYADLQIWEEAWQDKSLFESLFAVVFLVAFSQAVRSQVVPACENAFAKYDWTPMDNVVSIVEDPVAHLNVIGNDIVLNGLPITDAVHTAYNSFKNEEWFAFGENMGVALSSATIESQYIM